MRLPRPRLKATVKPRMRGRGSQETRARSALAYAKIVTMMMRIMWKNSRKMIHNT